MKTLRSTIPLLLLFALVLSMTGCQDKVIRTYMANVPTYQSMEDFRATTFQLEAPRDLVHPGKIYLLGNLLFVNEIMEGVHFFDNSNPAAPVNLGFLPVHANLDIAARGNQLYLDNYSDLLTFDISNPLQPSLIHRVEGVFDFQDYALVGGYDNAYPMANIYPDKGIITGWTVAEITEETNEYRGYYLEDITAFNSDPAGGMGVSNLQGAGLAGSTARFAIWNDYLYTLERWELGVFDISGDAFHVRDITLDRTAETLFPAEDHLFMGTTTGMLIYNLSDGSDPQFVSAYDHWMACDPVVVQGNRAYVTLREGTDCRTANVNVLEVIDISDLSQPGLLYSFDMTNPRGLGVDNDLLFLCDGPDGLKVFDKTDETAIDQHMVSNFPGIVSNDVIPRNGVLIMTSEAGIFQYDYSDPTNIFQISHIAIQP